MALSRKQLTEFTNVLIEAVGRRDRERFDLTLERIVSKKDGWIPPGWDLGGRRKDRTPLDAALRAGLYVPYYRDRLLDAGAAADRTMIIAFLRSAQMADEPFLGTFDRLVASTKLSADDVNDDVTCPLLTIAVINQHARIVSRLLKSQYFRNRVNAYTKCVIDYGPVPINATLNLIDIATLQKDSATAAVLKNAGVRWVTKKDLLSDTPTIVDSNERYNARVLNTVYLYRMLNDNVMKEVGDYAFDCRALVRTEHPVYEIDWRA